VCQPTRNPWGTHFKVSCREKSCKLTWHHWKKVSTSSGRAACGGLSFQISNEEKDSENESITANRSTWPTCDSVNKPPSQHRCAERVIKTRTRKKEGIFQPTHMVVKKRGLVSGDLSTSYRLRKTFPRRKKPQREPLPFPNLPYLLTNHLFQYMKSADEREFWFC